MPEQRRRSILERIIEDPRERSDFIHHIYAQIFSQRSFACPRDFTIAVRQAVIDHPQPTTGLLDRRLLPRLDIPNPATLPALPRADRDLTGVTDLVIDTFIDILDTATADAMMAQFHPVVWTDRVLTGRLAQLDMRVTSPSHVNEVVQLNRLVETDPQIITDTMLGYLIYHQLLHKIIRGNGHSAEFLELNSLWPTADPIHAELDTLHERWDTRPDSYPSPPPAPLPRLRRRRPSRARWPKLSGSLANHHMPKLSTFAPLPKFVPPPLRLSYLRTDITVNVDGADLDASEAVEKLGTPLFVLTAWDPGARALDLADDQERNLQLASELTEADIEWHHAISRDPATSSNEESFALTGCGFKMVRKLARGAGQDAFFEIAPDTLTVHGCNSRWSLSRPHGEPVLPTNVDTLGAAVEKSLGIDVDDRLKRFRHLGWQHLGTTELECRSCSSLHELFAVVHQQKSGQLVEHLTVVCPGCGAAKQSTALGENKCLMIDRWRDYLQARTDAEQSGAAKSGIETRHCYVIDLDMNKWKERSVYVGETFKDPEDRLQQHLAGVKAASVVTKHGTVLNQDLMASLPLHYDLMSSQTYEIYLGAKLKVAGYRVYGAH